MGTARAPASSTAEHTALAPGGSQPPHAARRAALGLQRPEIIVTAPDGTVSRPADGSADIGGGGSVVLGGAMYRLVRKEQRRLARWRRRSHNWHSGLLYSTYTKDRQRAERKRKILKQEMEKAAGGAGGGG